MTPETLVVPVAANTEEFDAWVQQLRLLVSQIGFALDGYLASRPPASAGEAS